MKRITQILASIAFIITVVTVYLAFDFAINNAISNKNTPNKRPHHDHYHHHRDVDQLHNDNKLNKRRSVVLPVLSQTKKSNRTRKYPDDKHNAGQILNNDRQQRNNKQKSQVVPRNVKPGNFHKSKTGVKVNKPPKNNKDQRRIQKTTTTMPVNRSKDEHKFPNKLHH